MYSYYARAFKTPACLTKAVARKEQRHLSCREVGTSDEMVRGHQGDQVSVKKAGEEDSHAYYDESHLALSVLNLSKQINTLSESR